MNFFHQFVQFPSNSPNHCDPNVGPSMNIINSPAALHVVEAPLPSSSRQLEDERGSRDVTPSTGHRSNRPPVRRVYPTSRHPMGEEATSITRASTLTSTTVTVSVDAGSDPVVPEPAAPSRPSHPHKAEDPWSKLRTSSEEATGTRT